MSKQISDLSAENFESRPSAPRSQERKSEAGKSASEKPKEIGRPERQIADRIKQDGDEDQVLADIAQNPEPLASEQRVENQYEPIRQETVDGICNLMQELPRLGEAVAFQIPYRTERRMPTEGVLDEETGLYVKAAYNPSGTDKYSALRPTRGLTIILSTPTLQGVENASAHLDEMANAIRKIYGESPDLEREIGHIGGDISSNSTLDRAKFELLYEPEGPVLNGFSATSGKERVPVKWWEKSPSRPISESGGLFLREILERVTQKQIEEAEKNRLLTEQVIDKVKDEAVPNDESKVYEYAYHATYRSDMPSISESGLQPSGSESKEPGSIFFTSWDSATDYLPEGDRGEGVLYRFRISGMPEIARSWYFEPREGLRGKSTTIATGRPIPSDHLDFSLDRGKTWMPAVSRVKQENAEVRTSSQKEHIVKGEAGGEDQVLADIAEGSQEKQFDEGKVEEYNEAGRIGRQIFSLAHDRAERRLTPFLRLDSFDREDVSGVAKKDSEQTAVEEDVSQARVASLAIVLEASTQIAEAQFPRGPIREDLESLEAVHLALRAGYRLRDDVLKSNPEKIGQMAKRIAGKRGIKTEGWTDQTAINWSGDIFQRAGSRIASARQAMGSYTGR